LGHGGKKKIFFEKGGRASIKEDCWGKSGLDLKTIMKREDGKSLIGRDMGKGKKVRLVRERPSFQK